MTSEHVGLTDARMGQLRPFFPKTLGTAWVDVARVLNAP
jgi:hypothetical protein